MIYYSTSTDNNGYIYIYTEDVNGPITYTISL